MRRADYFNEALVAAMLAAQAGGGAGESGRNADEDEDLTQAPVLRERIILLLDAAVRHAMADGLDQEHADAADFAVCAFIDEILLSSAWKDREAWLRNPLQLARHATATAGEDFYRILDLLLQKAGEAAPLGLARARAERTEADAIPPMLRTVLEIFAICLAQGFTGMYFNDREAIRGRLAAIARFVPALANVLANVLPSVLPNVPTEKKDAILFPAAYPDGPAPRDPLNRLRRFDGLDWLLWLAPLLAAGVLYHIYDARLDALLDALAGGRIP